MGGVGVRALGLLCNDPQRGHLGLVELSSFAALPEHADAIGIASLVDGSALLKRLPAVSLGATLANAVGPQQGRCTVVQVRVADELRPNGPVMFGGGADAGGSANVGPFRARSYAAAIVGGPQNADAASSGRAALLAGLPDFLARFVAGQSEAEAFFLAVLGRLHARGVLDAPHANGAACADAVREVLARADAESGASPRQVTFTNGVEIVHVAAALPSAVVTLRGLSESVAGKVDAAYVDSSMARERLRRFRGVLCLGALTQALKAQMPAPDGGTLQVLPDSAALIVNRDLGVRVL
jgi:hypothetical protein